MAHGPIPDKPEEIDAELAIRLALGLPVPDSMIDPERHPGLRESVAYADEMRGKEAAMQARIEEKREGFSEAFAAALRLAETGD